jgi:Flp pilus assembly protein TadG
MREPDKSRKSVWWRVRAACTALGRDRDGSVFFYTTLALPVIVGFAVLAIDGSRLMNLHSHLQHAADGLALAAAGELDRRPDACIRAVRALENLVENEQRFGDAGAAIITMADVNYRFLSGLPATDDMPIDDATYKVDEPCTNATVQEVRFIEVTVNPQTFTTLMPAAFIGASTTAAANATAVAGFKEAVCQFTPMMMCNPYEGLGKTIFDAARDDDLKGKMIEVRQVGGNTAQYFPGNFGFLSSPELGTGANNLAKALGNANPSACFAREGVDTEPGQNTGPVASGLNTRFGIYDTLMNSVRNNAQYRPAMNVRKGYGGGSPGGGGGGNPGGGGGGGGGGQNCSASDMNDGVNYQGLPRDQTEYLALDSGGRIWNGDWDFDTYWEVNFGHADIDPPTHPVVPYDPEGDPPVLPVVVEGQTPIPWSSLYPPSRYEVYRYEIENNIEGTTNKVMNQASVGGEVGAPQCGATATDVIDRRILHVAIVNCVEQGPLQGRSTGVPVEAFASFFLIRPVDMLDTIDLELVGLVEPGADQAVVRDVVQLYR